MERFINRQNIDRYRRLASKTTNATERQQILRLLADEEASLSWIRPWAISTKLGNHKQGTSSPKAKERDRSWPTPLA
jgi:hypothetical protein